MRPDDAVNAPSPAVTPTTVDSPPPEAQSPATAEVTSPPAKDDSASAFGTFRGRVIDAVTRKPLREFSVHFFGTQATKVGDEAPGEQTFHSADGRFEWQYLPPGSWTVTINANGYQRFNLSGLLLSRGAVAPEVVLPLRPGHTLHGRVYDEGTGTAIVSASISFRESDMGRFKGNWRMRAHASSEQDGSFVLDGVPPGRITLMINASEHADRELDVIVSKETASLEIGLFAGGTIAGRITAADGTAVAGTAGLLNVDGGFGGASPTGPTGEFVYRNLAAGRYELSAQGEGGSVTQQIVLAENQRIEGIVLVLGVGHSIRGVVTGLRPEDLQRVAIIVRHDGDTGMPFGSDIRINDHGAYVVRGVRPGRVFVTADVNSRRQMTKTIAMPAESDATVNFYFPPGSRLSGRITRASKPLARAWLDPRPAVEQPESSYGTSTSEEGEYVLEDLADGEYTIVVGDYKSRPVQISGNTVFNIDIPAAQLSGSVHEVKGDVPIVGVGVDICPVEPDSVRNRQRDQSDDFGKFELTGLEPGDYLLTVYKPGYEMFRKRISYESPIAGMTVRLREDTGVEVSVREAGNDQPLREVYVREKIGDRDGSGLRLNLDDNGVGYIPDALAGSTLSISANGFANAEIAGWGGQRLDLHLERENARAQSK